MKNKMKNMLRMIVSFFQKFSARVNTRWAWFFTNGMKEPYNQDQHSY